MANIITWNILDSGSQGDPGLGGSRSSTCAFCSEVVLHMGSYVAPRSPGTVASVFQKVVIYKGALQFGPWWSHDASDPDSQFDNVWS